MWYGITVGLLETEVVLTDSSAQFYDSDGSTQLVGKATVQDDRNLLAVLHVYATVPSLHITNILPLLQYYMNNTKYHNYFKSIDRNWGFQNATVPIS